MALLWLVQRAYFPARSPEPTDWPVPPGSGYYAVTLAGTQVGFASITVDTLSEGLGVQELVRIDLPRTATQPGNQERQLLTRTEALLTRSLRLRSWRTTVSDGGSQVTYEGRVGRDTLLTVVSRWGTVAETLATALAQPVLLPSIVPFVLAQRRPLRVGITHRSLTLDPVSLSLREHSVRVGAESLFTVPDSAVFDSSVRRWVTAHQDTLRAWRLDGVEHGLSVTRWIDARGFPLQITSALGLGFERSAFELVTLAYRNHPRPGPDLWWGNVALDPPAGRGLGARAPALPQRVLLTSHGRSLDAATATSLEGGGQHLVGDTVELGGGGALRTRPMGASAPDSVALRRNLSDEPLLRLGDPRVRDLAQRLTSRLADSAAAAAALAAWVRGAVRTEPEHLGLASASRTLVTRRGDTAARALLYVSLARASGLPSRLASGVMADGRGDLHFVTWPEVRIGDWHPVDIDAGRVPAVSPRLRLVVGVPGRAIDLAPRLGAATIQVLDHPSVGVP